MIRLVPFKEKTEIFRVCGTQWSDWRVWGIVRLQPLRILLCALTTAAPNTPAVATQHTDDCIVLITTI